MISAKEARNLYCQKDIEIDIEETMNAVEVEIKSYAPTRYGVNVEIPAYLVDDIKKKLIKAGFSVNTTIYSGMTAIVQISWEDNELTNHMEDLKMPKPKFEPRRRSIWDWLKGFFSKK